MKPILAVVALFLTGCVPAAIKQEIDFVDTVVQVGVKETEEFFTTTDAEEKIRIGEKAIGSLKRLQPHTENLKRWVEGEEPDAE
jgi:hypothetical protein